MHVADRVLYLDAIILELEFCCSHLPVTQLLVELRTGDDVIFADAIMYFKAIRDFEIEKLHNLQLFLQASAAHLARRMEFLSRFDGV